MDFSTFLASVISPVIDPLGVGAVAPVIDLSTISNPLPNVEFNLGLPLLAEATMSSDTDTSKASISIHLNSEISTVKTEPEDTQSIPQIQLQHQDMISPRER